MAIEIYLKQITSSEAPKLIYSSISPGEYNIVPGVLKNEVNKAGSFEFDCYIEDGGDGRVLYFAEYEDQISVEDTGASGSKRYMFVGRVNAITVNLQGQWHVTCEGLLANLLDFPLYMPSSSASGGDVKEGIWHLWTKSTDYLFRYAINAYRDATKRDDIKLGTIHSANIMDNDEEDEDGNLEWFSYEYPWSQSVGDFISSELLNTYGGILRMDYARVSNMMYGTLNWDPDPVSSPSTYRLSSRAIRYGENVLDATLENQSDIVNGIFPVGYVKPRKEDTTSNGTTSTIQYSEGKRWWQYWYNGHYVPDVIWGNGDPSAYNVVKAVDFGKAASSDDKLRKLANRYVKAYCLGNHYTVNAKVIDEHFRDSSLERIEVMGKYTIDIPFPGRPVNANLFCLSYEIDVSNPLSNSNYSFGLYVPPETLKSKYLTRA